MNKKILLGVLILSVLLAACIEETGRPNTNTTSSPNVTQTTTSEPTVTIPTEAPTSTPTPTPTPTQTNAGTSNGVKITTTSQPEISESWPPENISDTSPSAGGTSINLERGKKYDATVMEVIEGDIITIMFPEGRVETVKLLGVEVPETESTNNQPHIYKEITDLRCLADTGRDAKEFVNSLLVGQNCSIELDQSAGLRESGMLLAYVYYNGDFNKRLLEEGYAFVSDINYSKKKDYLRIQNEEARNKVGVWSCSCDKDTTPLTVGFYRINNDAVSEDISNLNDEYIILKNYGNSSTSLYNWSLRNNRNESYTMPDTTVYPGSTITLHSGSGVTTANDYYLGSSSPIWDNQHDSAYLYNSEGKLADYCRW